MIKDMVLASAGVVTAFAALRGINNWLRELGGRTRFDAALSLMRTTYALREAIFNCRAPLVVAAEFPSGYKNGGARPSAREEVEAWSHVFKNRWEPVASALREYETRCLEVEAIWGAEARVATQPLAECLSTLYAAIESYIDNCAQDGDNFKADQSFDKKVRAETFGTRTATDNELTQRILSAVDALESFARPHLRHR